MDRNVICYAAILRFTHPSRTYSGTIKASIVAAQLPGESIQNGEIRQNALLQLRMRRAIRFSVNNKNFFNGRMLQALEQHPFAHHSGSARNDDFESHNYATSFAVPTFDGTLFILPRTLLLQTFYPQPSCGHVFSYERQP